MPPGDPPAAVGHVRWRHDFLLLWSGSAVSLLGSMSASVAGPLLALSMMRSPVAAGWVAAAGTLPNLLLHLPAGVLADRLDRRRIMLVSQLLRGAVAATLTVFLLAGERSMSLLTCAAAISGICLTFYSVAEVSAVAQIVPRERLSEAMATNEARSHVALLLGSPLGGLLYSLGRTIPFLVDAVCCFVSAGALGSIRADRFLITDVAARRRGVRALVRDLIEGLARLWTDLFLRTALTVCTITNFVFQAVVVLLVILGKEHGLPSIMIGAMLAAPGLGGIVGTVFAPAVLRSRGSTVVIVACAWVWTALIAVIAASSHPWVWLFAWGGVGFMGAHMNVALDTYQASRIPPRLLGRVAGANRFLSLGAVPLGTLCGGYVIATVGTEGTLIGAVGVIGATAVVLTVRRSLLPTVTAVQTGALDPPDLPRAMHDPAGAYGPEAGQDLAASHDPPAAQGPAHVDDLAGSGPAPGPVASGQFTRRVRPRTPSAARNGSASPPALDQPARCSPSERARRLP
ncbi:MFS transporter [Actinoallomurus purpureus]|uniref:MFS transporter n=1 Tax=Actinoallomurus purpureus TaxID=478114 RepID=UPI002093C8AC|nr:MFS transporter [Actinoallomurus purpureus]MCO6003867.1 MFS transporter [Actinoallomurus purpureus]